MQTSEELYHKGLKRRLLGVFLAISAAVLAGGLFYHHSYRVSLLRHTESLLRGVNSFKTDQLLDWRKDRLERSLSLIDSPILSIYLDKFAADPADKTTAELLRRRLEGFIKHNSFKAAMLASTEGRVLMAVGHKVPALCPEALAAIKSRPSAPVMTDIHVRPGEGAQGIHIVTRAAWSPGGRSLFLILSIDPNDYLYPLVQKWPGPSPSAETLLVRRESGQVLFINELRHQKGPPLKLRLPLKETLPAAMAVMGKEGLVRGIDYRGHEVFAYISRLDEFGWAMVNKVDAEEMLSGARRITPLLLLLGTSLLAAAGGAILLLFRLQAESYVQALRKSENSLREKDTIFSQFMQHSPIYIFFKDENLRSLNLSSNFEKMLGRPLAELLGKSMDELFPSEMAKKMMADDRKILNGDKDVSIEEELNGRSYVTTKFPLILEGKPRCLAGYTLDITERKSAEEALRKSEDQLRSLWVHMAEGVALHEVVCDAAGKPVNYRIVDTNPQYEKILGIKADGRLATEVYGTPTPPYLEEFIGVTISGVPSYMETYFPPLNKHFSISIAPWGENGFATIFSDISARKIAELQKEKLNRDLSEAKKEMESFLYITTHDLRSPLVNIQGFSQNLRHYQAELGQIIGKITGVPKEDEARFKELTAVKVPEALDFVLSSSRRMDALITALLKVSRAGRVEMKPEQLEMGNLVKKVLAAMRFQLQEAGAEVKLGALPECHADPVAVSQIFSNLLDNAVKYHDRARPPEIEISGEIRGEMVFYKVADNGPGIPEKDLGRIWNVFYSHEHSAERRGEGIGLPMVRRIVERNGGNIKVESKEGAGTVFSIELPAAGGHNA